MIKIAVVLEKCEEGGFAASAPTVPGCFSQGETVEEALSNIAEAIELHLEAVDDDLIVGDEVIVKDLSWKRSWPSTETAEVPPQSKSVPSFSPGRNARAQRGPALGLDLEGKDDDAGARDE